VARISSARMLRVALARTEGGRSRGAGAQFQHPTSTA
jgi:hypothetical protein